MEWLNDLGAYYSHNKQVPQIRYDMLLRTFGKEQPEIMQAAAYGYMQENEHFPTVASLRKYVGIAREAARGNIPEGDMWKRSLELLAKFRQQILDRAYAGDVDEAQFVRLANQYRFAGYEFGAQYVERKYAEMAG